MSFPGAATSRDRASYTIVGAPLDVSTTFQPGTRFGPDRIRQFARSFEDYDHHTDAHFTDLAVHDHGDVHPRDDIEEYLTYLQGVTSDVLADGSLPLILGGEHTVSVAGIRAVDPDVIVSIDAHLDLRESFAGNQYNHACAMARGLETANRLYVIGARAGSESEWNRAQAADVTVIPPDEVQHWDPPTFDGPTYLTVDIDAADPGYAPATGTLEPFGLNSRELQQVVRELAPQMDGFDIVEVNDRDDGQTATLAAKLLRSFVFAHAAAQQ